MNVVTGGETVWMRIKQLTLANWAEVDPVNRVFGRISRLVGPQRMSGDDWAREFLSIELGPQVPEDVRDLFAVARGAMLYGWFFYPMYLLGEQQLHRVMEAAARTRYLELGGSGRRPRFAHAVEWLVERKVISPDDKERWDGIRLMRNTASHPDHQGVIPPGGVLRTLRETAHDINRLFARDIGGIPRPPLGS